MKLFFVWWERPTDPRTGFEERPGPKSEVQMLGTKFPFSLSLFPNKQPLISLECAWLEFKKSTEMKCVCKKFFLFHISPPISNSINNFITEHITKEPKKLCLFVWQRLWFCAKHKILFSY